MRFEIMIETKDKNQTFYINDDCMYNAVNRCIKFLDDIVALTIQSVQGNLVKCVAE